jgi:hypothetical protein
MIKSCRSRPLRSRTLALDFVSCALALVALALGLGPLAGSSAQAMTGLAYGEVVATHSGKCIEVSGNSTASGAAVVQSECQNAAAEQWSLQPSAIIGSYQLVNRHSFFCLSVQAGNTAVVQIACNNSAAQALSVLPQPAGGYTLVSQSTGDCVTVQSAGQADTTAIVHATCSGGSQSQLFQFEQKAFVAGAPAAIVSQLSGQCLSINNAAAVQYPCSTSANTSWILQPAGADLINIVNSSSGLCLEVGTTVTEATCSANLTSQNWKLGAFHALWQLESQSSSQCLTVSGSSLASGTSLVTQACANLPQALWTFQMPTLPASWTAPVTTQSVAAAAANLPSGKILTWAADSPITFGTTPQTYTELLDPVAGTDSQLLVTNTDHNMFCPGIANLPDGTIMVNGGDTNDNTSIYNPTTNSWTAAAKMNVGRAYEGTVLNADGTVFTLGGSWSTAKQGYTPGELWNSATGWKLLSNIPSNPVWTADPEGAYRADNHLWLHVLSGSRLLHAGPSATMHFISVYGDGGLGTITSAGTRGSDPDSMNGNASAFDVDMLLKVGGAPDYDESTSTPNALLINGSGSGNPVVTPLAPMNYARGFGNSVVLPNGQVVVVGGQTYDEPFTDTDAVLVPELWDPSTQLFQTLAPMATPRTYHSVALLLPDGRVWVSGGGLCGSCSSAGANHLNYEILTPPYLLTASGAAATRPVISSVNNTIFQPGATMTIKTAAPVKSFALLRLSSVTHTTNNDQRRIPLTTTTPDGATYTATLPTDPGILVPGYYMLFALDPRGVPSMAVTLQIT